MLWESSKTMSLTDQIEKIRRKPEHIRMRYVLAMVVFSTVFILGIWIISLKSDNNSETENQNFKTDEIFDRLNEGKEILENTPEGFTNIQK